VKVSCAVWRYALPRGELRDFLDVFGLAEKGLALVTCSLLSHLGSFLSSMSLSLLVCKQTLLLEFFLGFKVCLSRFEVYYEMTAMPYTVERYPCSNRLHIPNGSTIRIT
jgi:hypothetical protein